jgi:hypothetical protein
MARGEGKERERRGKGEGKERERRGKGGGKERERKSIPLVKVSAHTYLVNPFPRIKRKNSELSQMCGLFPEYRDL